MKKKNNYSAPQLFKAFKKNPKALLESLIKGEITLNIDTQNLTTPLHYFKNIQDKQVLEVLVQKSQELNILNNKDEQGYTPLMLAFINNNPILAQLLLQYGANVEVNSNGKHTALHWAYYIKNAEVLKQLVQECAKLNILNNKNFFDQSPLFLALAKKNFALAKLLLEYKADVKACNYGSSTPLHGACKIENLEILKNLVEECAKAGILDKQDNYGQTALILAVLKNNSSLVQLLMEYKADIKIATNDNSTILHFLSSLKDPVVKEMLVKTCAKAGMLEEKRKYWPFETAITSAVSKDDCTLVELLIKEGAKFIMYENKEESKIFVNGVIVSESMGFLLKQFSSTSISSEKVDPYSCMEELNRIIPLIKEEENILLKLVRNNDIEKIKQFLLQDKVSLLVNQASGGTILHYAYTIKDFYTLDQLVKKHNEAKLLNKTDNHKFTPLMNAVFYNNPILVKLLLEAGAKASKVSTFKETALHSLYLLKDYEAKELLIKYGAKTQILEKRNKSGETAMTKCLYFGDQESVQLLIKAPVKLPLNPIKQNNFPSCVLPPIEEIILGDSSNLTDEQINFNLHN